ncbi:hypothetical protein ColLi_10924 [Colletotrichum liriopes]|uniref:DUF7923 domain-containing protein n=1 Tax=Colletotrichum liriopes TaxID=708192 RepID=A0AA37GXB0_9PEZI|nr:hypothetical protein ColLi_10924 [Colletotrichum liriopes]
MTSPVTCLTHSQFPPSPFGAVASYEDLLQDYRRLRRENDALHVSIENYKQTSRGPNQKPFVAVLVDGDGYIFDESLYKNGADGGSRAAQSLIEAIKASLERKGLEGCDIVLRIYANVAGLSKTLYKVGLAGAEKRSIGPFIAGFNRTYGLADFIDAGEVKENADFKLRACLQLYAANAQCKHVYFAACHDSGYVSELKLYTGNHSRFTLVNIPSIAFHKEFDKLGMNVEKIDGRSPSAEQHKTSKLQHGSTQSSSRRSYCGLDSF